MKTLAGPLLALALLAGCGGSGSKTSFDPAAGGGVGGGGNSAGSSGSSGGSSGSTGSSGGSSSGSTGAPAGGNLAANLSFQPRTVVYRVSGGTVRIDAYQASLSCGQQADPAARAGGFLTLTATQPSGAPGPGQYIAHTDAGPSATLSQGSLFADGGQQVLFSDLSGYLDLQTTPGSGPLAGDFSLNALGSGGSTHFSGSFTANPCP